MKEGIGLYDRTSHADQNLPMLQPVAFMFVVDELTQKRISK